MITQKQLEQVTEYASLFFTIEEISLLTLIDQEELRREISFGRGELNKAYWDGKLKTQVEMRKKVKEWAEKGSPQAEDRMMEWLQNMNESE